jgi:uncharacterized membrane protein YcaP (DUF421 family)
VYTIIHAAIGYFLLLLVVRVLSRRPGGQLTPFEFVIVFLIGGLIILATVGDDKSVTNCICAIITVGLLHRVTARIRRRFAGVGQMFDGSPMVLLNRGRWHNEAMQRMRLKDDDVMAAARVRGLRSLDQIRYAVLERVGTVSVLRESDSKVRKQETEKERADTQAAKPGAESEDGPPNHG